MADLNGLTEEQLVELYSRLESLREQVNQMVNEYGYTANDLTTRKFEQDVERTFGKKSLKRLIKLSQNGKKDESLET